MGRTPEIASPPVYTEGKEVRAAFENLQPVKANLPPGQPAFWTLPRKQGEWRLPANSFDTGSSDEIVSLPMRDPTNAHTKYSVAIIRGEAPIAGLLLNAVSADRTSPIQNAYLNMIPQPMIMHKAVSKAIEDQALLTLRHFAYENSLARREYDVPMLLLRGDVIVDQKGNVQIGEFDDVCSLWSLSQEYNPIVESHIIALEDQMGLPIYTSELVEGTVTENRATIVQNKLKLPDGAWITAEESGYLNYTKQRHHYFHSEDWWGGSEWIDRDTGKIVTKDEIALIVRVRKRAKRFKEYMDYIGDRSITMAWHRDERRPLAAAGLGVQAANLQVALEFGDEYLREEAHSGERLVYKADGARTELTSVHTVQTGRGNKPSGKDKRISLRRPGESSTNQIRNKFTRNGYDGGPILIQPFKCPPTLEQSGVVFLDRDSVDIRQQKGVREDAGEKVVPGREGDFSMIFRTFLVFLPKEKKFVHVGGLWQASPGYIVHGGSHSVAGPLYIDGLMGHPNVEKYQSLVSAEEMVRANSLTLTS